MISILKEALEDQGSPIEGVTEQSPLIGPDALTTSLAFVSIIADIEMTLADEAIEVTLVSEEALSRSQSPFRTLDSLSDYVLELVPDIGLGRHGNELRKHLSMTKLLKIALVTGARRSIGRHIAEHLLAAGYCVVGASVLY